MSTEKKTSRMALSRRKRICFTIATVVLMLLLTLVAGEILVRLLRPHYTVEDFRREALLYESSIFCRHILLKEARVIKDIPHPDLAAIHINSKGYRGAEFAARKPEGTVRIGFLGGSPVLGFRLKGPNADWPARVEGLLHAAGFANVECINAGIPGHATFDSLGRYYSEIYAYEPDWVVLYQAYNDFGYFEWASPERTLLQHYRGYKRGNDPRINYQGWWDRLLCHSQLYTKVRTRYAWRRYKGWHPVAPDGSNVGSPPPGHYALQQYRLNVQLLCDAARNTGARVMLMTQAHLAKSASSGAVCGADGVMSVVDTPCDAANFDACDAVLREVAAEKGALFLDLSSELSGRIENFYDPVHLTPKGAERLSAGVAKRFNDILMPMKTARTMRAPERGISSADKGQCDDECAIEENGKTAIEGESRR